MARTFGFIYALGNDAMPGIYKIGHTGEHPKLRAQSLSSPSGCPKPFVLLAYFGCERPMFVERDIHEKFKEFRVNREREFFQLDLIELQAEFRARAEQEDDVLYTRPLDGVCTYLQEQMDAARAEAKARAAKK